MSSIFSIIAMIIPYLLKIVDYGIKQGKIKEANRKEFVALINQYNDMISSQSQSISNELNRQRENLDN